MAIQFNDNIRINANRPTDFRFGPFDSITQANSIIPLSQRYHGLVFGVYTNPSNVALSDIDFYYYWFQLRDQDYLPFGSKPPIDGNYVDQSAMIADQGVQSDQYIYYDGTSYWEYLGTTLGTISDYRKIGNVSGSASSTDNAIVRWDGTTGKIIQNGVVTLDDLGNESGVLSQQFTDGSAIILAAGKMWYNGTTGSWNIGMGGGNITQQIGEELFLYGKASTAIDDTTLQLVYKTGVVGASGVITFAPTIAGLDDDDKIIGIATEAIPLNGFGRVTEFGLVRGINTTGTAYGETWVDDDDIFYNPVTGGLTKVRPIAPNMKLFVGTVVNAGVGGSGSFNVKFGVSKKLADLDNLEVSAPSDGDLLVYNISTTVWENRTLAQAGIISPIPPIDGTYVSEALMIADQSVQLTNYLYYDGTSYWEYLGTTNNLITDYREISSAGGGAGCEIMEESFNYVSGSPSFNITLSAPKVWVFLNGVYIPEADYTLSGLNVTINSTIPNNSTVIIKYCVATTSSVVFPPVAGTYNTQGELIADQSNQVPQYIYNDGTYYWEYVGTTNGNITDYKLFGDFSLLYFEKTYSELAIIVGAGQLVAGATYLVTDFQTIHRIVGTTAINTGTVEPLFVKALNIDLLDNSVISQTYPNDIIKIDWNNILCEDGVTPRKGWIVDRIDPINDIHIQGYDWRNVRFRRYNITSKRKDEMTSLSTTSLELFVSIGGSLGSSLNAAVLFNANTPVGLVHDAGAITITVKNASFTYIKPLYKFDNSTTFTANELANRRGQVIYCPTRDAFVFMYMDTNGFGENIVGTTLAPYSSATWNPGNGISYTVNSAVFLDLLTLGVSTSSFGVHVGATPGNSGMSNNVWYNGATMLNMGSYCYNNTSVSGLNDVSAGNEFYGNIIVNNLSYTQFLGNEVFNCYFATSIGTSTGGMQDIVIYNTTYNCSFYLSSYFSIDLSGGVNSSFYLVGNVFTFTGGLYENSRYYLLGSGGGQGRTHFVSRMPSISCTIGYFNIVNFTINERLSGISYYQRPLSNNVFDSITLRNIPVGTPIASVGVTGDGDIVLASGLTLEDITGNSNISTVVLKHPDGIAPEDSATVGQVDDLRVEINSTLNLRSLGISISGAGNPITTGIKGYLPIPYNAIIQSWQVVADTPGSIVIDVWNASTVPTGANSITGAERPTLSNAQENQNLNLTTWNTTLTLGDVMAFNVVSADTVTFINLVIKINIV
jgi:hypothetical protein